MTSQQLKRAGGTLEEFPGLTHQDDGDLGGEGSAERRDGGQQTAFLRLDPPLPTDEMSTMELAALEEPPFRFSLEHLFKRAFDIVGAACLAIVFAPLIVAIVLVLRRDGGALIFRHKRVGLNGEEFDCLKFRTMVPDAQKVLQTLLEQDGALRDEWERNHKLSVDPRVTRLGRFLRQTSLDELPQLWNVFRGEMSLVGPRPVTREELLRYGRNMIIYMMVKPGITGLWQVSGRSETDYRRRVAIDVCYVRNQGFLLDLWILLKTTMVVLGRRGAY